MSRGLKNLSDFSYFETEKAQKLELCTSKSFSDARKEMLFILNFMLLKVVKTQLNLEKIKLFLIISNKKFQFSIKALQNVHNLDLLN